VHRVELGGPSKTGDAPVHLSFVLVGDDGLTLECLYFVSVAGVLLFLLAARWSLVRTVKLAGSVERRLIDIRSIVSGPKNSDRASHFFHAELATYSMQK
jgi:hypothetical protein